MHLCANCMLWIKERLAALRLSPEISSAQANSLSERERLSFAQDRNFADLEMWLRNKLRRAPRWLEGHIRLGEISLATNDLASAYACAQAATILVRGSALHKQADAALLLARCYLRRGVAEKALETLTPFVGLVQENPSITEELAASHLALGNYADVVSLLQKLDAAKLSSSSLAALEHARFKMN